MEFVGCFFICYCVKAIWFPTSLPGLLVKLLSTRDTMKPELQLPTNFHMGLFENSSTF